MDGIDRTAFGKPRDRKVAWERSRERVVGPVAEAPFPCDPITENELLVLTEDVDVVTAPMRRGSIPAILAVVVLVPLFAVTSVLTYVNSGLAGRRTTGEELSGRP